jgi:hypothetical protein
VKGIYVLHQRTPLELFSLSLGTSGFSFSFKPSSSFDDLTEKKPLPSKTAVPKENFTSHKSKEKAVQPAQASSTASKVS